MDVNLYMYVHMYVCMYVCMYVHIQELKFKLEETESQKSQLSNEISELQGDFKMKKTKIEMLKEHSKSNRKKLEDTEQKVCKYMYVCMYIKFSLVVFMCVLHTYVRTYIIYV